MWKYEYKDYPLDSSNLKVKVEPGKGIKGCEMHEIYGWQDSFYIERRRKLGFLQKLHLFFKKRNKKFLN